MYFPFLDFEVDLYNMEERCKPHVFVSLMTGLQVKENRLVTNHAQTLKKTQDDHLLQVIPRRVPFYCV